MIYAIEVHTIKEFIVTARKEDDKVREPIAKCNSMAKALTIRGLYEKAEEKENNKK